MSTRRMVPVAIAVIVIGIAIARFAGAGGSASLLSLDSSGSSSGSTPNGNGALTTGQQKQQTNNPQPTPGPGDLGGLDQSSVTKNAFILLNPASATANSAVGVSGSGFDPASAIDFYLTADPKNDQQPQELGFAQADSGGSFGSFAFNLPPNFRSPTFTVIAKERNSSNQAMATGRVESLRPSVKLGTNVGTVGDQVQISAQGFAPSEEVKVYFNNLAGDAIQTFKASNGGTIEKQAVRIPYGPVGNNSLVFVGSQSQSPVTVPFLMLTLYPNVALSSYATKADTVMSFSGTGFGPDEDVEVHLNNPQAPPIVKFKTGSDGTFDNAGSFVLPFELTGKNTLIFVGSKSQATATAGFDVLPYTPNIQPSTYGGRPGTTITFYGDGFARGEVVRIYVDRTQNSLGKEVSCAKADDKGQIGAGGSYTIPPDAQAGQQQFTAQGTRSKALTTTAVEVQEAGMPISPSQVQQQGAFQCPFDDQEATQSTTPPPQAAASAPTPQRPPQSQAQQPRLTPQPRPTMVPTPTLHAVNTPVATRAPVSTAANNSQPAQGGRAAVIAAAGGMAEMRTDPSKPGSGGTTLDPGSRVQLLGDSRTVGNEQWVHIRSADGSEGWVPATSVQITR